jgi:regulator of nucleoside diphosphate kinase
MTKRQTPGARSDQLKPQITITIADYDRLSSLARAAMNTKADVASCLMDELNRANLLAPGCQPPDDIVCMGCEVEFRDETTGKVQKVTLVYPGEADIGQGKISVLTPIGTALIGLAAGQSITWETRTGVVRRLTVLQVREPAHA